MSGQEKYEIELTDDLLDFARRSAIKEAKNSIPDFVDFKDVTQHVTLKLLSRPPKFDPSKGTQEKTLIYLAVQRHVAKYLAREFRHVSRFKQVAEKRPKNVEYDEDMTDPPTDTGEGRELMLDLFDAEAADAASLFSKEPDRRPSDLRRLQLTLEYLISFLPDEESQKLCTLFIKHKANRSKVARELGVSEGTVRSRLLRLAPKLRKAGFPVNWFMKKERQ